jgi:hypothetical protein
LFQADPGPIGLECISANKKALATERCSDRQGHDRVYAAVVLLVAVLDTAVLLPVLEMAQTMVGVGVAVETRAPFARVPMSANAVSESSPVAAKILSFCIFSLQE